MSHKNILLVEGEADRAFFEALCQNISAFTAKSFLKNYNIII